MAYGGGYAGGYADSAISLMPGLGVQVAFDTMPDSEDPEWFDVTADLRVGSTRRGRQRELDVYTAGEAEVTLGNKARHYDPDYSAGDHWPNVKPMRRMRILTGWDDTTYPLFDGFADSWPQGYSPPHDAWVTLQATDGFKVLNKKALPASPYAAEVSIDEPAAWWRFSEPEGAATAIDEINGWALTKNGTPVFGVDGLVNRDDSTAAQIVDPTDGFQRKLTPIGGGAASAPIPGGPFSIEWIYKAVGTPSSSMSFDVGQTDDSSGPTGFEAWVDGFNEQVHFGVIAIIAGPSVVTAQVETTGVNPCDGDPHHICCVWEADGDLKIYVDGVDRTDVPDSATIGVFKTGGQVVFGSTTTVAFGTTTMEPCIVDEYALYDHELTAARVAAHAAGRSTAWAGELTGDRINRVLDLARWPAALRDIDDGKTTLQSSALGGTALEHAQRVEQSEFGSLFISSDGNVRFIERDGAINRVPLAVFGDDTGDPDELGYRIYTSDYSDELIRNPITISRNDGVAQTAVDQAGLDEYLDHQFTLDGLLHDNDTLSRDAADFLISEYKDPKTRIARLVVMPRVRPDDLFPIVLAAELGDVLTVIRRPQGVGDPISQDCEIQAIEHQITPKGWETTFTLSPAYTGSFLELDSGTGRLSTAGAELAGALDAVATTFDVTMTGGDLFTTSGADFPFDVTVGAERMTATDIDGASSPQEFIVTRPNPTAHAAGEAVQVADPVRIYF